MSIVWRTVPRSIFFLTRPRRFGKSLLTSTLRSYFEGRKDLFKGLAIEQQETEWTAYPVLHFSMAGGKHMEKEQLEDYLAFQLSVQESKFDITPTVQEANTRLSNLIMSVYKQTGQKVVVLIDEYDAPLLDVVHEEDTLPVLRNVMRNFYSPLKDCDPYLRFVFLTGITKFSQLSLFSELNNIRNISMLPEYAGICGITKEELETQMRQDVETLGERLNKSYENTLDALRIHYDGYHFTWPSPDVFNPFSLLSAFADGTLNPYWFTTGTPTYLIEMMRKYDALPSDLAPVEANRDEFGSPTESLHSLAPLLYQSGYLTIKDYDREFDFYTLDIPNREVKVGLTRALVPTTSKPTPSPPPTRPVAWLSGW